MTIPTNPLRVALVLALACGLMLGCSSKKETEAGLALKQFYEHLNAGDYTAAMALYSAEALEIFDDPDAASQSAFADWARTETKRGSVKHVEVVEQREVENGSELDYAIVYRDGSSVQSTVTMTEESGAWKLGLIRRSTARPSG